MRHLALSTLLLSVFALSIIASHAQSVQVLQRARLGNSTEAMTYVPSGPLTGNLAIMDGYQVIGVLAPCSPPSPCTPPHELFDSRHVNIQVAPRGITYVESTGLFALVDPV